MSLTKTETELLNMLLYIPPHLSDAENLIKSNSFTSLSLTKVALEYLDDCMVDVLHSSYCNTILPPGAVVPNLNSTYLYEIIELFICYGMDPNDIYDDTNIMHELLYVDNGYIAADTLALLIEHGGNPMVPICEESVFSDFDFDIFFEKDVSSIGEKRFASLVHCWMVMVGYCIDKPDDYFTLFKDRRTGNFFELSSLKNHRNYYFGFSHDDAPYSYTMHIYDKTTLYEVMRVK